MQDSLPECCVCQAPRDTWACASCLRAQVGAFRLQLRKKREAADEAARAVTAVLDRLRPVQECRARCLVLRRRQQVLRQQVEETRRELELETQRMKELALSNSARKMQLAGAVRTFRMARHTATMANVAPLPLTIPLPPNARWPNPPPVLPSDTLLVTGQGEGLVSAEERQHLVAGRVACHRRLVQAQWALACWRLHLAAALCRVAPVSMDGSRLLVGGGSMPSQPRTHSPIDAAPLMLAGLLATLCTSYLGTSMGVPTGLQPHFERDGSSVGALAEGPGSSAHSAALRLVRYHVACLALHLRLPVHVHQLGHLGTLAACHEALQQRQQQGDVGWVLGGAELSQCEEYWALVEGAGDGAGLMASGEGELGDSGGWVAVGEEGWDE